MHPLKPYHAITFLVFIILLYQTIIFHITVFVILFICKIYIFIKERNNTEHENIDQSHGSKDVYGI